MKTIRSCIWYSLREASSGVLRLGAEWERFSFGLPDNAPLPNILQSVSLVMGLDMQFSDSIIIRAEGQPGVYDTEFDKFGVGQFQLPIPHWRHLHLQSQSAARPRRQCRYRAEIPGYSGSLDFGGKSRRNGFSMPCCQLRVSSLR